MQTTKATLRTVFESLIEHDSIEHLTVYNTFIGTLNGRAILSPDAQLSEVQDAIDSCNGVYHKTDTETVINYGPCRKGQMLVFGLGKQFHPQDAQWIVYRSGDEVMVTKQGVR